MINKTALAAIKCYKLFISPLKGFKCAYGSVHGVSCSTVISELIKEHGVVKAKPHIKEQFVKCRATYEEIRRTQGGNCDCAGADLPCYCWGFPSPRRGRNDCDVLDCEVGGCDVGPC